MEAKPVIKKVANVNPPPLPQPAKTQPESADVWGARTDDSVTSAAPRKSAVVRQRRAATVREPTAPKKWLIGGIMAAGMILMLILGMWIGDMFKTKSPDGNKEPPEKRQTKSEEPITNSIGMKLVLVKPGTFDMGSPPTEENHQNNEELHTVEITQSFYVGVYEVTQEQYQQVMGDNPSWFSSTRGGDKVQGMDTRLFPVEMVSWDDAVAFCHKLSELPEEKANRRNYRLPTEAQWEYICRGGHFYKKPSPPLHFGNSLSSTQANFDGNNPYGNAPKGPYLERTEKIGRYPPILSVYTISTAMFGNGATTGTTRNTTNEAHGKIRKVRKTASVVFCAAAPGTSMAGSASLPAASTMRPATVTATSAFVLFSLSPRGISIRFSALTSLLLYLRCGLSYQRDDRNGASWHNRADGAKLMSHRQVDSFEKMLLGRMR